MNQLLVKINELTAGYNELIIKGKNLIQMNVLSFEGRKWIEMN